MTRGRVVPAAFISQPHLSLDHPASPEPPVWQPLGPSGDLLLLQKTELAGDGVGLDMMYGAGVRGARQRSITKCSAWTLPIGFLAGPGGSPATSLARERCSFPPGKEKPLHQKVQETHNQPGDPSSQLCLLDKFLSSCPFLKNKNPEESWVEVRGRGSLLMMLLLASGIRAVPEGQVGHFCARRGKDSSVWAWIRSSHDVVTCMLLKGLGH